MKKLTFLLLLTPTIAFAQSATITSYTVRYFNAGAPSPFQTQEIPLASVQCNVDHIQGGTTVNPTTIEWDDVANTGKACRVNNAAYFGDLTAFPLGGSFEATLIANSDSGPSSESNRAPFSRAAVAPNAPSGLRIVR